MLRAYRRKQVDHKFQTSFSAQESQANKKVMKSQNSINSTSGFKTIEVDYRSAYGKVRTWPDRERLHRKGSSDGGISDYLQMCAEGVPKNLMISDPTFCKKSNFSVPLPHTSANNR
jgi:hypothetical protein